MARSFNVTEAVREKVYPKIAFFSPSGGGKTYTSLRVATGMKEEVETLLGEKAEIWLANNEGSRGKYYANEFNYKIIELAPPHEPEMYYDLIDYAERYSEKNNVYVILIVDSLSKEWAGTGGCLDIVNSMRVAFQEGWKKVSPRHRRLMDELVDSHLTILATMRGEDQYTIETDEHGKQKPVKLGVGAKQGKDFEYEFTCTFSLDQKTNTAESFKDNTHLFENRPAMKLTEEDGRNLIRWANTSNIEPEQKKTTVQKEESTEFNAETATIEEWHPYLFNLAKAKAGVDRPAVGAVLKALNIKGGNPNNITDIEIAKSLFKELNKIVG